MRVGGVAALALAVVVGCGRGDGRTVLTVYSPHGKDLLQYFETAFEQAHPTIDVQWVDMGSQDVLDRLRSEAANPQADLWFGAPADIFARAAGEGLLAPYTPTWAAAVPDEAKDPQSLWFGTYLTPEVIAYNSEAVTAADAPKDWDDVLDPRWKGKVLIRDPLASGSMRAIFGAMILRGWNATNGPDSGYAWLRRLDANTKEYTLNPAILYQKLARQEGLISLYDMPDIATIHDRLHMPVAYVIPKSGTPILVDAIAIVHGSRHPREAESFYEFVTTPGALEVAAQKFFRIPVRTDVPLQALPEWVRQAKTDITPLPMDRTLLARHLDEWMKYWDANIRNRGRGS
ncbi:MAG TPA: extracellular solute-binding protein [Gemmatimonadaceae bacterium]|nr:extracellular solute-binding protein [Gemmatimonadaceae bacterium]